MTPLERQALLDQIRSVLSDSLGSDHNVIAVYLFGSALEGPYRPSSDIDLAFLVRHADYRRDPLDSSAAAYLAATAVSLARDRKTDVIILNGASVELAFEIVTEGACILDFDPEARIEYEVGRKGLYYDFKPFLEKLRSEKA